jgi:HK97 gp10 family phage protein
MAMTGRDRYMRKLAKLSGADLTKAAGRVLFTGAAMIQAEAQNSIVRGSISKGGHVVSLPGQPPNNDTDHLKDNIETSQPSPLTAEVRSEAEYAAALEWGTSKMAARPYMRPARDKMAPKIHKLFATEIDKLVARA